MDITKWKSVAVRIDDYTVLRSLGEIKYRSPASMFAKVLNDYVKKHASKNNKDYNTVKDELLHKKKYELKF